MSISRKAPSTDNRRSETLQLMILKAAKDFFNIQIERWNKYENGKCKCYEILMHLCCSRSHKKQSRQTNRIWRHHNITRQRCTHLSCFCLVFNNFFSSSDKCCCWRQSWGSYWQWHCLEQILITDHGTDLVHMVTIQGINLVQLCDISVSVEQIRAGRSFDHLNHIIDQADLLTWI